MLQFMDEFRYLGHYIKDNTKDDAEIRNTYTRTNVVIHRFGKKVPSMLNYTYSEVIAYVYMALHSGPSIMLTHYYN